MPTSPLTFFLNVCTVTVLLFSVHLLVLRAWQRQAYLPLAICLGCIALLLGRPTITTFFPDAQIFALCLSLPALLAIAPCFYLYVEGITSDTPWQFDNTVKKHFVLSGLGLAIACFAVLLPDDIVYPLLRDGDENVIENVPLALRYALYAVLILTFVLVMSWVLQAGYYVWQVIRRLSQYRTHLKDVFASTETREASWLNWLLIALAGVWFASALNLFWDNIFHTRLINETAMSVAYLIMIWGVALWGLRQKPGFEEIYQESGHGALQSTETKSTEAPAKTKYTRSALNQELSAGIAQSIERAMLEDKLYLDNALSLQRLARHINSTPNYVSQTLNETLQISFFDFINRHRILDAQQRLVSSDTSVVDIAMDVGFNAKSSFYTAFKKEAQMTPVQYRKQHQQ